MPETPARGKEKEKKKALMPLANRLGLDEGATTNAPPATVPPAQPATMGNLVESAMQKRRDEQETPNGGILNDKGTNRAARLGGARVR